MLTLVPEIIIHDTIEKVLAAVKNDLNNTVKEEDTILFKLLADQKLERYSLYEQAKTVFNKESDDVRKIAVNVMFNRNKMSSPTIHITLPSEDEVTKTLGLGMGEYESAFFSDEGENAGKYRETYSKRFKGSFNVVITSDNVNEIILIYYVLRALIIGALNHFYGYCMYNFHLGGRDMMLNPDLVPKHIFMRSLTISFEYNTGAVSLHANEFFNGCLSTVTGEIDAEATNGVPFPVVEPDVDPEDEAHCDPE